MGVCDFVGNQKLGFATKRVCDFLLHRRTGVPAHDNGQNHLPAHGHTGLPVNWHTAHLLTGSPVCRRTRTLKHWLTSAPAYQCTGYWHTSALDTGTPDARHPGAPASWLTARCCTSALTSFYVKVPTEINLCLFWLGFTILSASRVEQVYTVIDVL